MAGRGCCASLAQAWQEEPWGLPEPRTADFTDFRGSTRPLATYRLVAAVYWSAWIVLSVLGTSNIHIPPPLFTKLDWGFFWLIFLTNWTMVLLALYLYLAWLASVVLHGCQWYLKLVWTLRNTSALAAVLVTALYWTLIFPFIKSTSIVDVHCHAVNTIIMLADLALAGPSYYLKHIYQPLGYLLVYLLFSIVYFLAGGRDPDGNDYIYPPLDYDKPLPTSLLIVVVVLVVAPLLHVLLWAYARYWERRSAAAPPEGASPGHDRSRPLLDVAVQG